MLMLPFFHLPFLCLCYSHWHEQWILPQLNPCCKQHNQGIAEYMEISTFSFPTSFARLLSPLTIKIWSAILIHSRPSTLTDSSSLTIKPVYFPFLPHYVIQPFLPSWSLPFIIIGRRQPFPLLQTKYNPRHLSLQPSVFHLHHQELCTPLQVSSKRSTSWGKLHQLYYFSSS